MKLGRREVIAGALATATASLAETPVAKKKAEVLLDRAWEGLDPARVLDCHVHMVGTGVGGTGCYVNEHMTEKFEHPLDYFKFSVYRGAAGVKHEAKTDSEYVERLLELIRARTPHGRALILAFDQVYDEAGKAHPELTEFHTPNAYVIELAKKNPDAFVPCASVHPYRADAAAELEKSVKAGAVAVKWLPNAMRIDPSSPACDAFYRKMAELDVPLLTHSGEEKAVKSKEAQRLGNPLHLRRPLDAGVRVIVAHCASLGKNPDLDLKDGEKQPWVDNFDLFLRLAAEKKYEGKLFGDISAVALINRLDRPLRELLKRTELHPRLCNGSDYPLPAISFLNSPLLLEKDGFITSQEREALDALEGENPLAMDFAMKRTVHLTVDGKEHRFPPSVFMPSVFRLPPSP